MAYLLAGERPAAAAMPLPSRALVLGWLAPLFAARARRRTLTCLMGLDAARLRDLGVTRADLLEAARAPDRGAGEILARARARNAGL